MAPSTTVCISSPGSMGAAIAAKFTAAGFTVLCPLSSRSPSSQARAKQAKMENASLREIVKRADWILSILPPSSAIGFAQEIHDAWNEYTAPDPMATPRPLVFVDCNAINLSTVRSIAQLFDREQLGEADAGQKTLLESIRRPVTVLDAGIIGGPPSESYNPTIYASAAPSHAETLALFASLGDKCGLKIKPLRSEGSDIGAASALKMSYAGISKGVTGIFATMILSAHANSPSTAEALLDEVALSMPDLARRMGRSIPMMIPKAYRFVGEMEEIAGFVEESSSSEMGVTYHGLANTFSRVASSPENSQHGDVDAGRVKGDVDVLKDFAALVKTKTA